MEDDNAAAALDSIVTEFHSYEDFLDSQITSLDLYYLEDEELARQLVELGYRGSGEVLKREEFESRKAAAEASRLNKRSQIRRPKCDSSISELCKQPEPGAVYLQSAAFAPGPLFALLGESRITNTSSDSRVLTRHLLNSSNMCTDRGRSSPMGLSAHAQVRDQED
ncbi:hypothetical protein ACEWY4_012370 [Coilia grayii]|uniref:Cilia- and flagella-associated protein 299 n=1 Tax=Coilia grayii TaxID=363190 RepID=A0ABD1K0C3_9TELE